MPRPIILGVVGDSAAGKTTITRGLMRALGEHTVTHTCTDDYHRYDRKQRAELGITPLHPDCNHLDVTYAADEGLPEPIPAFSGLTTYDRLFTANGMSCE